MFMFTFIEANPVQLMCIRQSGNMTKLFLFSLINQPVQHYSAQSVPVVFVYLLHVKHYSTRRNVMSCYVLLPNV